MDYPTQNPVHSKFSSIGYEIIVISLISGLLFYNILLIFTTTAWLNLIPISVQTLLLFLFVTKHKYLPLAIKIWGVTLIVSGGMGLISVAMGEISDNPGNENFIWKLVKLVLGIILYLIGSREIELVASPEPPENNNDKTY